MESESIKAKIKYSSIAILLIGGICMMTISSYFFFNALSEAYPQIIGLFMGSLFFLYGTILLFLFFSTNRIEIKNENVLVKSIFGYTKKIFNVSEGLNYIERERGSENNRYFDLTFFVKNYKLKISSSLVKNYSELTNALTNNIARDTNTEKLLSLKAKRRGGYYAIISGVLFISLFSSLYLNGTEEILRSELTTIDGTILNDIKISNRKGNKSIQLYFSEYPNFIFHIRGDKFSFLDSDNLTKDVKTGDLVSVDILTDIYEKKITKTKELSFWDKIVNYNQINIYGMRNNKRTYFTFVKSNNQLNSNAGLITFIFILILAFGFALLFGGIFTLVKTQIPEELNIPRT